MNERLRKIREKSELTQRDFAKRIGVGASTLAMFETGDRSLKNIHIQRICDEFNVNEVWLRTGEGQMFLTISNNTPNSFKDKIIGAVTIMGDSDAEILWQTIQFLFSEHSLDDVQEKLRRIMK